MPHAICHTPYANEEKAASTVHHAVLVVAKTANGLYFMLRQILPPSLCPSPSSFPPLEGSLVALIINMLIINYNIFTTYLLHNTYTT
jgi:hypothetical protein